MNTEQPQRSERVGEATEKSMPANQARGIHESIQSNMEAARKTPEYAEEGRELERSEQQEWTYEKGHPADIICVGGFPKWSVQGEAVAKGICDAANTALTAAKSDNSEYYRKCYIKCANDFDDLRQELAAERQKREQVEQELTVVRHRADTSEEAEVAERQRREQAERECLEYARMLRLRTDQHLSALAAIEKLRQIPYGYARPHEARMVKRDVESVVADLSLLHEHDAEVRKPLVDALEQAFDILQGQDNVSHGQTRHETIRRVEQAKALIADALANVKQ